jgi:F-type H+-transporting ATPase subunit a
MTGLTLAMSMKATELGHLGPLVITNSMIASVIAAAVIIFVAQLACRKIELVPEKGQNFFEVIIEWLLSLVEPIVGEKGARKTFWFFASIFIFIVASNFLALVPGVGTIGRGMGDSFWNVRVTEPFLRGTNADVNMTFSMALVFMVLWLYWSVSELGFGGFVGHLFGSKAKLGIPGFFGVLVSIFFFLIFVVVGLIEVVSILFRPISLSARLFGNIYGGEYMLESMYALTNSPWLGSLVLIPFYFFELLVAVVQALVFCLLTAAFVGQMIKHDDHPSEEAAHH